MLKGKLYATKDINMVVSLVGYGAKALYMGDPDSINSKGIDFYKPTSLVPTYDMLMKYIDGDYRAYEAMYLNSLNTPIAHETFATIIGSLYFGNSVVLYFPQDTDSLGYPEMLLKHIMNVYGITAETKTSQYFYDISKNTFNLRLMYIYNIINAVDFIIATDSLDDLVIDKLRKEIPVDWCVSRNVSNAKFVEIIESKKQEIIRYGKVLPVLASRE